MKIGLYQRPQYQTQNQAHDRIFQLFHDISNYSEEDYDDDVNVVASFGKSPTTVITVITGARKTFGIFRTKVNSLLRNAPLIRKLAWASTIPTRRYRAVIRSSETGVRAQYLG